MGCRDLQVEEKKKRVAEEVDRQRKLDADMEVQRQKQILAQEVPPPSPTLYSFFTPPVRDPEYRKLHASAVGKAFLGVEEHVHFSMLLSLPLDLQVQCTQHWLGVLSLTAPPPPPHGASKQAKI